jgi:hypothetical protein
MDVGISGDHEVATDYVIEPENYWITIHMRWAVTRALADRLGVTVEELRRYMNKDKSQENPQKNLKENPE